MDDTLVHNFYSVHWHIPANSAIRRRKDMNLLKADRDHGNNGHIRLKSLPIFYQAAAARHIVYSATEYRR